jgi:hypothetical protein
VSIIQSYKEIILGYDYISLDNWSLDMPDLSNLPEYYWQIPYGDDENDSYNENALRSSTLNDDIKSVGWSGLILKNKSGNYTDNAIDNIHPSYDSLSDLIQTYRKFKGKFTEVSEYLPNTTSFIKNDLEKYFTIGHAYILKVTSHGFIKEHRDIPAKYNSKIHKNYNMLNTFMMPINDPSNSYFILNKKQMPLAQNRVLWFNSSLPHLYFNMSNKSKYFLLFTGLAKKNWIEMTVGNMLH